MGKRDTNGADATMRKVYIPRETHLLYSTQCSLPVLAELVAAESDSRTALDAIVAAMEDSPLEPFALVVINSFLDDSCGRKTTRLQAVSLPSGNARPTMTTHPTKD